MENDLQINETIIIPGRELWMTASLSGGPGGQHVNKVHSRVTLHWHLIASTALTNTQRQQLMTKLKHRISADGVLQISSDSHRSQHRNRELAREKMAVLVQSALQVQPKRIPTRVSRGARQRRLHAKRHRGAVKMMRRATHQDHE
jgi:ribosome-associated protein